VAEGRRWLRTPVQLRCGGSAGRLDQRLGCLIELTERSELTKLTEVTACEMAA